MSLLDVIEYPDPRLRRTADPVVDFDDTLATLVEGMLETVDHHKALGLSGTQVEDGRAVLVIQPTADPDAPRVYINPELVSKSGLGFVEESCLSLPGIEGNVMRAMQITVRAFDVEGSSFEQELSAMDAVSLQHEMDHLVGKLFIDRMSVLGKLRLRSELKRRRGTV